jgi:hypothetical protein
LAIARETGAIEKEKTEESAQAKRPQREETAMN